MVNHYVSFLIDNMNHFNIMVFLLGGQDFILKKKNNKNVLAAAATTNGPHRSNMWSRVNVYKRIYCPVYPLHQCFVHLHC